MQNQVKDRTPSPTPGCLIFILAGLILGGFLCWTLYQGIRLDREISKFTVESAQALPKIDPTVEETTGLSNKLKEFTEKIRGHEKATLSLTPKELHLLLIQEKPEMAHSFFVAKFGEYIEIDIAFPLNSLRPGKKRYLNGRVLLEPKATESGLAFFIHTLQVPQREVPQGFRTHFELEIQKLLGDHLKEKELTTIFQKINHSSLKDSQWVLQYNPVNNLQTQITDL